METKCVRNVNGDFLTHYMKKVIHQGWLWAG